jgi:hypothetical protein
MEGGDTASSAYTGGMPAGALSAVEAVARLKELEREDDLGWGADDEDGGEAATSH